MYTLFASRLSLGLLMFAGAALFAAGSVVAQGTRATTQPREARSQASVALPMPSPLGGIRPGAVPPGIANPAVADVDGSSISLAEIGDAIRALPDGVRSMPFEDLYRGMLDRLVAQRALVMQARREHLDADPVVRRHVQEAADRALENEQLYRMLDKAATDDVLRDHYQKEFAGKPGPEEVHLWVILVPTEQQARSLIKDLAAGADFAALARRDSIDTTRQVGGDMGFRRQDQLAPEIGGAAFVMEPGQLSPNPVRAGQGWFVIKVEARRRAPTPSFAEARERLRLEVLQAGVSRVVHEVVANADVHEFNVNGSPVDPARQ